MEGPGAPPLGELRRCGSPTGAGFIFCPLVVLSLAELAADCDAYDLVEWPLVGFDGFLRAGELFSPAAADVCFEKRPTVLRIRDS